MTDTSDMFHSKFLSFSEVIQNRDSLVKVTCDGLLYAVDLVMVMTGKDRNMAANVIRRIPVDLFETHKFVERQLTKGGHPTKLISFHDAIELVMVLPGKKANKVKTQFANVIKRYLAGDQTLISEVNHNAASSSPVAQLARESTIPKIDIEKVTGIKRTREESEMLTDYYGNTTLATQMGFIDKAFEYQRQAVEVIEHGLTLEQNQIIIKQLLKQKNDLLDEIEKIDGIGEILDIEIQDVESEYNNVRLKLEDTIKTIRILSDLRIESDFLV